MRTELFCVHAATGAAEAHGHIYHGGSMNRTLIITASAPRPMLDAKLRVVGGAGGSCHLEERVKNCLIEPLTLLCVGTTYC